MPRWRELPDGLDPQVRVFAEQLREVVDRAGLSVASVADRTGYGRSSWERYLDGRLLAPRSAVVALAEITGTPVIRLTTMRELAEAAWSRSETQRAESVAAAAAPLGEFGPPPLPAGQGAARRGGPLRVTLFLAGVAGVALVAVGAFVLTGGRDARQTTVRAGTSPAAPAAPSTSLPAGVRCSGSGCTGKDAEEMGCGGDLVTTAKSAMIGTTRVEVRYSRTCGAAWGRITQAAPGDEVRVKAGSLQRTAALTTAGGTIAYTPMIAVGRADQARACAVLASGAEGCTR
ncbi:DUF2690 domain-containing protein [Streptomyces sp. NPDC002588]|uniref:helix-turn-helix domain-containing protein n=1 Tax=Streptomyces sp. NPDC002588 TaxID=3154419 RepID=UPI0033280F59